MLLASLSEGKHLKNGLALRSDKGVMHIVAMRDDVLRIRAGIGELPEDASWAVLPGPRQKTVEVVPDDSADTVGFHTNALRVEVRKSDLRLRVTDLNGIVLQEDAPARPLEFRNGGFRLYKSMPVDEHYLGLGDKPGPLDRREQAFTLWNTDAYLFQESTDPIYKSIPFFLTMRAGRSVGVLLDSTWRSSFDFGKSISGVYSFGADGGGIDYYLLFGPDPKRVVETYGWLTGVPPLPPLWAFGYQQSRYSYESEKRVREIASHLRKDKIPADAIYLDIDFQKNNFPFTVNTETFPNFAGMLADLKTENFHLVAITDLHIAKAAQPGYAPYDSGMKDDHFVKNPDGSVFVGRVWPGPSVFPEFTRAQTREWWGSLYEDFVNQGVAGFWNDMNEPSVFGTPNKTMPEDVCHRIDEPGRRKRVATHLEIHDVFGMENSRGTYEGLLNLRPDQRPFVLTRATYAGGQRYATTWTGDNTSSWNHLRMTTPMLLNLGLSGFGFSGADVGGFVGTPKPELLTKWIELASFQPIDRNHTNKGAGDREPWVHGPEHEALRRRYIEERYRLLPYLYTTAEELSRTGVPMLRPLFLEFPHATADGHPLDIEAGNQFLVGRSLLVAPPPFPEQPDDYDVRLPPGDWYDYWTGAHIPVPSGIDPSVTGSLRVHPTLETLPVFVQGGSIIPTQPLIQSTGETPNGPLTLRVYPGHDCQGSLYLDDGKTLAYQRGEFLRLAFTCDAILHGIKLKVKREGTFKPWWQSLRIEVYGWDNGENVTVNSTPYQRGVQWDRAGHVLSLEVVDDGGAEWDIESR